MTHPLQERLVRELLAQDSSLKGREKELRALVQELLANDPVEKPSPAFVTTLREELRERTETLSAPAGRRWLLSLSMALTGTAAATALLVLFLPGVRESLTRSRQATPATREMYYEEDGAGIRDDRAPAGLAPLPTGMGGGIESSVGNAADTFQASPDTPERKNLAAPEAPSAEPSMMMQMRLAQPEVTFPADAAVPKGLPGTATMHDPERGDRPVTVRALTLEEVKQRVVEAVTRELPPGTETKAIAVGSVKEAVRSTPVEGLPGPVELRSWALVDVRVDGKALSAPITVPLQWPTFE